MKKPKPVSPALLAKIAEAHRSDVDRHRALVVSTPLDANWHTAWAAAYEEAARRVEGAPLKIDWRRVWAAYDKWYATDTDDDGASPPNRKQRHCKLAALVRAELRRKEER
mgnify:CR=1 FL=1